MKVWEKELFGRKLRLEYGKVAKQSLGSVVLTYNQSTILVTADAEEEPVKGGDFFPLTVEFQEKFYAVGKIPGGFIKREGKPSDEAILAARLIDRPIRPLFPENFYNEVQVIVTVFSMLGDDSIETWGITGASLALNLSPIPFNGLVAGVRIGYVDGRFIVFPTQEELKRSKMDIVVAGTKEALTMVEGEALEVSEEEMVKALMFAQDAIKEIITFEEEILSDFNVEKWEIEEERVPKEFIEDYLSLIDELELKNALLTQGKKNRDKAIAKYKEDVKSKFEEEFLDKWGESFYAEKFSFLNKAFEDKLQKTMRALIINENRRVDGRGVDDIREISCEVGLIPRVHGSGLFTRGETQSLAVVTLGAPMDVQLVDTIFSDEEKRFMLHYNFPPFSTGEVKRLRGVSRREIGHGHLAERAHKNLIPSDMEFPYTIRVVSEILESNGSSSMASVCSASLALMDAGVPIKKHVAGIAMGLVFEEDRFVILTDILGMEDHLGDMDFKVAGTREGITAFQMDVKTNKIDESVLKIALEKAKIGRLKILDLMYKTIAEPRKELASEVPIIKVINIPVSKIGEVIGPSGRVIKEISEIYDVEIYIEPDGRVKVNGRNLEKVNGAVKYIKDMTEEVESEKIFEGTVKRVENYGIFVEVLPGKVGMLHKSNLKDKLDTFKIGDKVKVEVLSVEEQGKFQLKQLKEE